MTVRTTLRNVADRVKLNVSDIFSFGPTFVLRHLGRLKKDKMTSVQVPGFGRVHVRAGDSDIAAVRQVFGTREYATDSPPAVGERIRRRYKEILAQSGKPVIVDAGANIGAATLWFAKAFPEAVIVAVEPDPGNAAVLRRNVGHRPNCVVLEAAIGAERGFVSLSDADMGWAVQTTRAERGVAVVTIDDALAASGGQEPFIVKIDIEGFESDLFASNTDWLSRCYIVAIEPHDWMLPGKMTSRTFQQAIAQHPFEMFIHGESLFYVRV